MRRPGHHPGRRILPRFFRPALLLAGLVAAMAAPSAAAAPEVTSDVPVTAMNNAAGPANNSPQIVADPDEPDFVVAASRLDAPDFQCALQASSDGGRGWITVNPVPKLPKGVQKCYAPEVAFDGDGVLHYLFVGLRGRGNEAAGVFLTSSTDRGQHFTKPRRVLGPFNFGVRMAIDRGRGSRGRIHLAWLHSRSDPPLGGLGAPPNPIMSAYSDDGGMTFSKPVQVSDPARRFVVAPALAVGPGGEVHVGYYDLQDDARDYYGVSGPAWDGTWSLVASSSSDGGRRFSRGVNVDDRIRSSRRVMLIFTMPPASIAAGSERVCAAWTDARRGDDDALARCSADQGRRWGELRRLNDDGVGNGRSQYLPRLSISPGGRIDALFLDRRRDPNNNRYDAYYTYSADDGASFARNVRLTGFGSDSRIGQQYAVRSAKGQFEFGSRLGLLSQSSSVLAMWPDTHNSSPLTRQQDLFASEVRSLPNPGGGGTAVVVIGLLLLAVAGIAFAAWRHARTRRSKPPGSPAGAD